MSLLLVSPYRGGIPDDADDIGQSAAVGWLFVESQKLRREGPPFKVGDMVRPIIGMHYQVGNRKVDGGTIGRRRVTKVEFIDQVDMGEKGPSITGWVAYLELLDFAVQCDSLTPGL